MQSSGGLAELADAADHGARLLLSGPAGGVAAVVAGGARDAVSFDMGGTSTDVCLIRGGSAERSPQRLVGGLPVRLPQLDINTVGAGGGSIAWIDQGGALRVGPRSARGRSRPGLLRPRRHSLRPSPTPTWCWAGSTIGSPWRAGFGSTARLLAGRWRAWPTGFAAWLPLPAGSWRWQTRRWWRRSEWSRSNAATIPATWSWWPSAAPGRCTPARWPMRWESGGWRYRPPVASTPPWGSRSEIAGATRSPGSWHRWGRCRWPSCAGSPRRCRAHGAARCWCRATCATAGRRSS